MNRAKPLRRKLSVPLDPQTAFRLATLCAICNDEPETLAASLLHDILLEDDLAHPETSH